MKKCWEYLKIEGSNSRMPSLLCKRLEETEQNPLFDFS